MNTNEYTPEEFEKAKKWHDKNRLKVNYAFPDTFIEGMRQVKNLDIQRISQQREQLAIEGFDEIIKADVNGTAAKIARACKNSIANCV